MVCSEMEDTIVLSDQEGNYSEVQKDLGLHFVLDIWDHVLCPLCPEQTWAAGQNLAGGPLG